MTTVNHFGLPALYLEQHFNDLAVGSATGFVVRDAAGVAWLVTNRHVVTGLHQETGKPIARTLAVPNALWPWHHVAGRLGNWSRHHGLHLYDSDERPTWVEHPVLGAQMDAVAMRLDEMPDVDLYPHSLVGPTRRLQLSVTSDVFVTGYPLGYEPMRTALLPVWSRGTVAAEPDIDVNGLPVLLVDARTRSGQSGSPVLLYASAAQTKIYAGDVGSITVDGVEHGELLGVYSGRTHRESDLGFVWKLAALRELIEGGVRPTTPNMQPYGS